MNTSAHGVMLVDHSLGWLFGRLCHFPSLTCWRPCMCRTYGCVFFTCFAAPAVLPFLFLFLETGAKILPHSLIKKKRAAKLIHEKLCQNRYKLAPFLSDLSY